MSKSEAFWLAFILGAWLAVGLCSIDEHYWGSKGHACFANHTRRENLKCMVADGIDPTCVKP